MKRFTVAALMLLILLTPSRAEAACVAQELVTGGVVKGANPKGWWFSTSPGSAQHTYGNPPAEAMLEARNSMVEQVVQIAREVWK